jgi:hypothetical protein
LTSRNTTSQVPKVDITHFHHSSCQFGQVQRCFPSSWSVPLPAIHCNTTGHIALQPMLSVSRSLLRRNHGVTCTTLAAGPLALASCHPPSRWRAPPLIMLLLVQCPKTAQPRFDRCWGGGGVVRSIEPTITGLKIARISFPVSVRAARAASLGCYQSWLN